MRRAFVVVALWSSLAPAQEATTGVAVNRFVPAVGPASLVGVEGASVTAPGALSWVLAVGALHDPIKLSEAYTGRLLSRPVRDQLVGDVALEVGIWKRLALAVGVPVVLYQDGDRLQGTGVDERPLAATAAGDVRVRVKAALTSEASRLHVALLLQVTAPTGGRDQFAATADATVEPRLMADARLGRLTLALSAGARFQKDRALFTTRFGDELTWAAALAAAIVSRPPLALDAVVEAAGAVGPSTGTRPAELRAALRLKLRAWLALDAGAGAGLDRDVGAPAWRVFAAARGTLGLTR